MLHQKTRELTLKISQLLARERSEQTGREGHLLDQSQTVCLSNHPSHVLVVHAPLPPRARGGGGRNILIIPQHGIGRPGILDEEDVSWGNTKK